MTFLRRREEFFIWLSLGDNFSILMELSPPNVNDKRRTSTLPVKFLDFTTFPKIK